MHQSKQNDNKLNKMIPKLFISVDIFNYLKQFAAITATFVEQLLGLDCNK